MKLSASFTGFIIAMSICLLSLWIYFYVIQKDALYVIDNPTDESMKIFLDKTEYSLAPNQSVNINMDKGQHTVWKENSSEHDTFNVKNVRGTINVTRSVYVIFALPYGSGQNTDSIFRSQKTVIDDKIYYGKIRLDSSIFIQDYYYGLNENFPGITLKSEYNSGKLRSKIFRKDDFKQFYFQKFE